MPQLIRPQEVKVLTQNGEVRVSIMLDLNINLNASGGFDVTATARDNPPQVEQQRVKEDTQWAIPDFGASPKINFGKKE